MARIPLLIAGILVSLGLASADDPKPKAKGVEGLWEGKLTIKAGLELRLAFKFTRDGDALKGTMDSPDQGARDLPLDEVTFKDGTVSLAFKKAAITYSGKLNAEGTAIEGTFVQGDAKLPLNLKRVDKLSRPNRPQEPKPPFPYKAEDVTYENAPAKVKLAATLTLPEGKGPFPAVVLITGSGPQDRDETVMEHKPFLILADHLTRKGVAVLRADDRGVGKSTGDFAGATTLDFMEDALAGVAYLRTRPEIDTKRIGLIGHSEGGLIAPMAAVKNKDVAFIVMLAGPGLPGSDILAMQSDIVTRGSGVPPRVADWILGLHKKVVASVLREKDDKKAREAIRAAIAEELKTLRPEDQKTVLAVLQMSVAVDEKKAKEDPEGAIRSALELASETLLSRWFRYFLAYDPRPTLAKVTCPVLALNGEKDAQVPSKANLDAVAAALKEGGNKDATTREMPGLNHLFQTCKTGLPGEYALIEETFAPAALEEISSWVLKRK